MTQTCTDCDKCGEIGMCYHVYGGTYCWYCLVKMGESELVEEDTADHPEDFFSDWEVGHELSQDEILEQQELEDFEQTDEYFGHFGE
jgi:hypothetical protein